MIVLLSIGLLQFRRAILFIATLGADIQHTTRYKLCDGTTDEQEQCYGDVGSRATGNAEFL